MRTDFLRVNTMSELHVNLSFAENIIKKYSLKGEFFFDGVSLTYLNPNPEQENESDTSKHYDVILKLLLLFNSYEELKEQIIGNQALFITNLKTTLDYELRMLKREDTYKYQVMNQFYEQVRVNNTYEEKQRIISELNQYTAQLSTQQNKQIQNVNATHNTLIQNNIVQSELITNNNSQNSKIQYSVIRRNIIHNSTIKNSTKKNSTIKNSLLHNNTAESDTVYSNIYQNNIDRYNIIQYFREKHKNNQNNISQNSTAQNNTIQNNIAQTHITPINIKHTNIKQTNIHQNQIHKTQNRNDKNVLVEKKVIQNYIIQNNVEQNHLGQIKFIKSDLTQNQNNQYSITKKSTSGTSGHSENNKKTLWFKERVSSYFAIKKPIISSTVVNYAQLLKNREIKEEIEKVNQILDILINTERDENELVRFIENQPVFLYVKNQIDKDHILNNRDMIIEYLQHIRQQEQTEFFHYFFDKIKSERNWEREALEVMINKSTSEQREKMLQYFNDNQIFSETKLKYQKNQTQHVENQIQHIENQTQHIEKQIQSNEKNIAVKEQIIYYIKNGTEKEFQQFLYKTKEMEKITNREQNISNWSQQLITVLMQGSRQEKIEILLKTNHFENNYQDINLIEIDEQLKSYIELDRQWNRVSDCIQQYSSILSEVKVNKERAKDSLIRHIETAKLTYELNLNEQNTIKTSRHSLEQKIDDHYVNSEALLVFLNHSTIDQQEAFIRYLDEKKVFEETKQKLMSEWKSELIQIQKKKLFAKEKLELYIKNGTRKEFMELYRAINNITNMDVTKRNTINRNEILTNVSRIYLSIRNEIKDEQIEIIRRRRIEKQESLLLKQNNKVINRQKTTTQSQQETDITLYQKAVINLQQQSVITLLQASSLTYQKKKDVTPYQKIRSNLKKQLESRLEKQLESRLEQQLESRLEQTRNSKILQRNKIFNQNETDLVSYQKLNTGFMLQSTSFLMRQQFVTHLLSTTLHNQDICKAITYNKNILDSHHSDFRLISKQSLNHIMKTNIKMQTRKQIREYSEEKDAKKHNIHSNNIEQKNQESISKTFYQTINQSLLQTIKQTIRQTQEIHSLTMGQKYNTELEQSAQQIGTIYKKPQYSSEIMMQWKKETKRNSNEIEHSNSSRNSEAFMIEDRGEIKFLKKQNRETKDEMDHYSNEIRGIKEKVEIQQRIIKELEQNASSNKKIDTINANEITNEIINKLQQQLRLEKMRRGYV